MGNNDTPHTLRLVYGPDPIFSKKAVAVTAFNDDLRRVTQNMVEMLYHEKAVGIGANMVGLLQQIIVIDLQETNQKNPQIFINPHITEKSVETQSREEASICFPGISARITRPRQITLHYQDVTGKPQIFMAEDYLATVIQHEYDYLEGRIFLDYLTPLKRKMLIRKSLKYQKQSGLR